MPGIVYNVQPQPPVEADTRWIEAGALTFGVEYRDVDPASLAATYGTDDAAMDEIEEHSPEGGFVDQGVSIHVRGTDDGHEYLRFDVFDAEPHYHYVRPTGDHNNVVEHDVVANGDMLRWAIERLRSHLTEMLTEAGGAELARHVDPALVAPVIDEVAAMAEQARQAQRAAAGR